ncbi:MAG: nitroreductase family deazaflavin-dependent oxidoreductase [Nocardioidaceae bacterium]|nr:nitroreductase family deazaflavin-dependent oxidoreductase [Nocardioidaceae bacterium]
MPVPVGVTQLNKKYLNPLMVRLAGHGPFVELEHVGRTSGRVFRTPIMAFRHGDVVTIALTYGPKVDWLKNIRAAGSCRMLHGGHVLTLGAPAMISAAEGMRRMPVPPRVILPIVGCEDFIELTVLHEEPVPAGWKRATS